MTVETFLRAGGDVFALRRIPGHYTLAATRNYVALTDTDIKAAHLRASPADRLYRQPAAAKHARRP